MAEMLKFKRGLYEKLPQSTVAGTIYVTTDEKAMYVDLSTGADTTGRIRLGDIIQYESYEQFREAKLPFNEKAFYYLVDENALLKYRGTDGEGEHVWQQVNSVSDIQADLTALATRVSTAEGDITGLQAAVGDITKEGGAIAVAKQEAIDAAAADATSKANAAESNAKADAKAKIDTLTETVNDKANASALNSAVSKLENEIAAAKTAAAEDATSKANTAESNAKSYADSEISTAKTALQTNINTKANQSDLEQAIVDLEKYADDAEAAANTYTDNKVATALAEADAMTFRGTVSLSKALPTTGVQCGDTYKVAEKGTYADFECFVGDLLIASADQGEEAAYAGGWEHISSGYEDDYDPSLSVDGNKVFLRNTVGAERGSVTFVAADESVNVSVSGTADPATGIANTTVTIGIEWGLF